MNSGVRDNGGDLTSIDTPALVIDAQIFRLNFERVRDYCDQHHLRLRPHFKSFKCLALARILAEYGVTTFATAKVSEAEVLANLGVPLDLHIAYPVYGQQKIARLGALAAHHTVVVSVDSEEHIRQYELLPIGIRARISLSVIIDVGFRRCGLDDPEEVVRLVRCITECGMRFAGLHLYFGQLYSDRNAASSENTYLALADRIASFVGALTGAGQSVSVIASGATPSLFSTHLIPMVNEVRVGTALMNDFGSMLRGETTIDRIAGYVLTTVTSSSVGCRRIVDAGSKTLSARSVVVDDATIHGYLPDYPHASLVRLNEEHGWIELEKDAAEPALGQRIRVVPCNISLALNMFEECYLKEFDSIRRVAIEGRGKVS